MITKKFLLRKNTNENTPENNLEESHNKITKPFLNLLSFSLSITSPSKILYRVNKSKKFFKKINK